MDDLSKGIEKDNAKLSHTEEVQIDGDKWHAQQAEAKSDPIFDPGQGGGMVVRNFFFKADPKLPTPSKADLVAQNKHLIEMSLWGDGLSPVEDKQVHVYNRKQLKVGTILRKKMVNEGADFVIMVVAKPRTGVALVDTPQRIL